jgi:hypothetical protein
MNCSENTLWGWDQYILDYIPLCNQQIDLLLLSLWYRHRCLITCLFATSKVRGPRPSSPYPTLSGLLKVIYPAVNNTAHPTARYPHGFERGY